MHHDIGLIIVGAGGHGKVVLSVAEANAKKIMGYLDDNPTLLNQTISTYPVVGTLNALNGLASPAILGLGNNKLRKRVVEGYHAFTQWDTCVHPHAYVHPSVKLGEGTVVFAGAVIQPDVKIGKHCIINTGATVDHDCIIGDYSHIAPGVHLAREVKVAEGTLLGIGCVVIPQIHIGEWAIIGAGGVVISNIPPKALVMGVPAKERH